MPEKAESESESRVLPPEFFARPEAKVARDLIGFSIVRSLGHASTSYVICETEAYEGEQDLACHSSKGRTARTEVMFGLAGRFYVYRIYGLHWMLNVVTGAPDEAAAVLVRGIEGVNGPVRVAAKLKVDSSLNGCFARPDNGLWFEKPLRRRRLRVSSTPRIGID